MSRADRPGVKKPVKVLFLTACTGRGGAGNSLFYLLKYIDRSRIEPLVVMPPEGIIEEKLRAHNIRYVVAPRLRERSFEMRFASRNRLNECLSLLLNAIDYACFIFGLTGIVLREKAALIHCNHMMVKLMGACAGLLANRRVVFHCRTIYGSTLKRLAFNLIASLPNVRRIIAVSGASAASYRLTGRKVRVVHNGADLADFSPDSVTGRLRRDLQIPAESIIVGYMGRIVEWKGIAYLLRAAEQVLSRHEDTVFVLMGDNAFKSADDLLAAYRQDVEDKCLSSRILFTGFCRDVRPYLKEIDVLVVPSISPDPCPRSVIEALAFGVPVVGSAIGGISELVQHGRNGFLVEPRNVADLTSHILKVVEDGELRGRMAAEARKCAVERHDAAGVARRIQEILLDVAGAEGRGGR